VNENTIIKSGDLRKVRTVSENLQDEKRIAPYIRETEQLDVMPAIGALLYKQFSDAEFAENIKNDGEAVITTNSGKQITLTESEWNKILEGDYYTSDNGSCSREELKHSAGLLSAIAHLAYARMLPNQPLNVTAFGVVKKTTNLSEPVDETTLFRAANEARKIGLEYLRQSVDHLRCKGFIDEYERETKRYRKFIKIG
jgi:hypothetical protein